MEIIKLDSNTVFLLETETSLPEREAEVLIREWNKHFPNNPLIITKKGTIKALVIKHDSD